MKALHVIETLNQGGAEQALLNLLPSLKAAGIESSVATLWGNDSLAPALESQGINVHRLHCRSRRNLLKGAKAVSDLAQAGTFDLLHSHLFFAGIYTGLAGALLRCPLPKFVTFHNLAYAPGCNKPGFTLWLRKQFDRAVLGSQMCSCIAVSSAVADHYRQQLGLSDITIIPNGLAIERLQPENDINRGKIREVHGLPRNLPLIAMPARLAHEKGHLWLLDALADLPSQFNFHLAIVGDGPMRAAIKESVRKNSLQTRVSLLAGLPQAQLFRLIQSSDLVVAPSIFEGFGLAAAEAMCLEVPVIATRAGGLPDLLGSDGGVLVDCYDKAALQRAIIEVINDTAAAKIMARRGRRRVVQNFSTAKVAHMLAEHYHQAAG